MAFKVITKEKARNYLTSIVKSFEKLKDIARSENIELDINKFRLSTIIKKYDDMLYCLKRTTMKMGDKDHIDSHKISALFLVVILFHKDVVTVSSGTVSAITVYPHIYLAFILGNTIMEDMCNESNKDKDKVIYNINMNYAKEFVKLIYSNEKAILTPAKATDCHDSYKGVFFLSHIFYFIEQVADKQADL